MLSGGIQALGFVVVYSDVTTIIGSIYGTALPEDTATGPKVNIGPESYGSVRRHPVGPPISENVFLSPTWE